MLLYQSVPRRSNAGIDAAAFEQQLLFLKQHCDFVTQADLAEHRRPVGKPVVYSGAGEGARLIERANDCIVVRPKDPGALADARDDLARHPAVAATLGANGRRFAEAELTWSRLVGRWLDHRSER